MIAAIDGGPGASETLLAFVAREECVTTQAVSYRFGCDTRDAAKMLRALRRDGLVQSERRKFYGMSAGVMNVWSVTAAGRAQLEES